MSAFFSAPFQPYSLDFGTEDTSEERTRLPCRIAFGIPLGFLLVLRDFLGDLCSVPGVLPDGGLWPNQL